ncbi:histone-like nucleoid-structuring protein Lsr2 [Corynebacterium mastitidis]|uniref:histone-like nucleoid-structuring protein Lsr2 n=1 Tax=Corynebacterium mastitidis TaxID=161890 RepID=UPI001461684D|nr:Lsr2 family protein [Corynebacterium mastitidis]
MTMQYKYHDDYSGKTFPREELVTVHYTVDGTEYEIDLSEESFDLFMKSMDKWTSKSRVARRKKQRSRSGSQANSEAAAIRKWAQEHGYKVGQTGRIAADIKKDYHDAQKNGDSSTGGEE